MDKLNHHENELILYNTEDGKTRLECRFQEDSLWLSLNQLSDLFQRDKSVISKHLKNIFEDEELEKNSVVANHATTAADGKSYQVDYYSLEAIFAVGYNELLTHAGKISAKQAKEKAHLEYDKFRKIIDLKPSQVDKDLDAAIKQISSKKKKWWRRNLKYIQNTKTLAWSGWIRYLKAGVTLYLRDVLVETMVGFGMTMPLQKAS